MPSTTSPTPTPAEAVRRAQLEAARRVTEWHAQRLARHWGRRQAS